MKYKTLKEQLIDERRKNEALQARVLKNEADTAYIAMMTDTDLEPESTEGKDNGQE